MLPGVELARRRRVHYHGDAAAKSSSSAAEHQHHHHYARAHHVGAPAVGVAGPALAARIRLEEKLRGAALPSSPSSRWSRLMRHNRQQQQDDQHHQQAVQVQEQQQQQQAPSYPQQLRPSPPAGDPASTATRRRRRAELTRTLSMVDVCAVCLEEVREGRQQERVTRLPCSHKYHSDCVLPWLAIQPDCPCCRALVPSAAHATLLIP